MTQPLVTIAISTYNRSASLDQFSLPAIQNLTYSNYEVIIVDDCSTDDIQSVLIKYKKDLKNLRVLRNEKTKDCPFQGIESLKMLKEKFVVFTELMMISVFLTV
ncbi:MAG: glycosyltransferase [Leptolyngbyaceae cyanobacterium CSU_1_3]|nr:glycosyltransferase [Leptolyngbyaceae cyanobacterium CSU_1_3]